MVQISDFARSAQSTNEEIMENFGVSIRRMITPYFLKYFKSIPNYEMVFRDSKTPEDKRRFMAAAQINGKNYIAIYSDTIEEEFSCFSCGRLGQKIYFPAYFLEAMVHEFIHLLQPRDIFHNFASWHEGAAYYISWLVVDDIYKDAESEKPFWSESRSFNDVFSAIQEKRLKIGIKRVLSVRNAYFYLVLGGKKGYTAPVFLPDSVKESAAAIARRGYPAFPVGASRDTFRRITIDEDGPLIQHLKKAAKGVVVTENLVATAKPPLERFLNKEIEDATIESIFKRLKNKRENKEARKCV